MITFSTNNLGGRHRELNEKVKEAVLKNVSLHDIANEPEKSDVDKLFKIDLASKYKDIGYILNVLKSGDSLYISRAMKCIWIYDNEFSNYINAEYLHANVIPFMSMKMKRKLLTTISIYVKEERANDFYKYCRKHNLGEIALKFLINTNEETKLEAIKNHEQLQIMRTDNYKDFLKHFIKNSFILADKYLSTISDYKKNITLYNLRYLYTISPNKYLDLLCNYHSSEFEPRGTFGIRISKDILTKHKYCVFKHTRVLITLLNKNVLVKKSTIEDAKKYLEALLPDQIDMFWHDNFYGNYMYIINIIPPTERFSYVKNIFTEKYPGKDFEMTSYFFHMQLYTMMSAEEREEWALKQIASQSELLGEDNDYIWYKFVNFHKAFSEIKRYVMITTNKDKRTEIIKILIESAKNQHELAILLQYYYDRHVNEDTYLKESFIDKVFENHNVFNFDNRCWEIFNKILSSLAVYDNSRHCNCKYRMLALMYHVVHVLDVPEVLKENLCEETCVYSLQIFTDYLTQERQNSTFQYFINYYVQNISNIENRTFGDHVKFEVEKYVRNALSVLQYFKKTKSDCPQIVEKYYRLGMPICRYFTKLFDEPIQHWSEDDLMRHLKCDAKMVINDLPQVKSNMINNYELNINRFILKIKTYFAHDVAKEYFDYFVKTIENSAENYRVVDKCVYNIFQLADDTFKIDFMTKYVPESGKIDHSAIDSHLLRIQKAICRYACKSRPPVPLSNLIMYIKGDYVHFCLPMFNLYLANLPMPQCMTFVAAILDAPLSIQKHGVRLAFKCFSVEDLKTLVASVWNKTKNVSLRLIIYRATFEKVLQMSDNDQMLLFEVLKQITKELNKDDNDVIYFLITSTKLPEHLLSEFIEAGWTAISKFSNESKNLRRKTAVIKEISHKIKLMRKEFVRSIIDDHMETMIADEKIFIKYNKKETADFNEAKWDLMFTYLTFVNNEERLNENQSLVKIIINKCLNKWNQVLDDKYRWREFLRNFIISIEIKSYLHGPSSLLYTNLIFKSVLKQIEDALTIEDSYLLLWELHLGIITRDALYEGRNLIDLETKEEQISAAFDVTHNFSKKLCTLITDFVDKQLYYNSFSKSIKDIVLRNLEEIIDTIEFRDINIFDMKEVRIITSIGLTETKSLEMYLLAANILVTDYDRTYKDQYEKAMERLKSYDNVELRCFLRQKFLNHDYKYREDV